MTDIATPTGRSGQSSTAQGTERPHTLVVLVEDRPGAVDRVVGLMRRRRANMQTLVFGRSEQPNVVRVTVAVNDSEVGIEHLIEQLRKIFDVRNVLNVTSQLAITRELALIKVDSTPEKLNAIVELGHHFGAHAVDIAPHTVILEVTGSEEKIERLVSSLQEYGVREIARSGRAALTRGTDEA